ncbi:hypothetical protein [Patulibacter sp. SYSU D01012]|uniref:hypothetical protein n=1 Tax=Patulibacter sp. SYSU D01012 TaxID=2817381 RepID=UPI001B314DE2|nr:hypothetical protein [Patulibacter sp. SYSU D01012]
MNAAPSVRPSGRPRPRRRRASGPSPRVLLGVLVALLVVVAVVVLACGGKESAADTVSRAFGKGESIRSADVDVRIGLTGSAAAGGQPLDVAITGPYETGDKGRTSFDLDVALSGAGTAGGEPALGLLAAGGKTYVKLGGQPFQVDAKVVDELKTDDAKQQGKGLSFSSLGIDPRSWLKDPKTVGDEELKGEDVTHVRAGVDTARLAGDLQKLLGRAEKAADAKQTAQAAATVKKLQGEIRSASIDVWAADGQGALRRMKVDMTLKSGKISFDFGLSKINEPVRIAAPKDALPLDQLLSALGQGSSGASGSSSSSSGQSASGQSSSSGSSSSSSGASAYDRCLEQAGQDITKLQACAKLAP